MDDDAARLHYAVFGTNGEGLIEKAERIEHKIDAGVEKVNDRIDKLILALLGAQVLGGAIAAAMVRLLS